jgi:hypothetical protein
MAYLKKRIATRSASEQSAIDAKGIAVAGAAALAVGIGLYRLFTARRLCLCDGPVCLCTDS